MTVATPLRTGGLRAEVVDTEAAFHSLQADWEDLIERSDNATAFSSFDWARVCWQQMRSSASLYTLTFYDGPTLVGLAPLCISKAPSRLRVLQFITMGTPQTSFADYLDVISAAGYEERVIWSMLALLKERKSVWQAFDWHELSDASASYKTLRDAARGTGLRLTCAPGTVCHTISLSPTWAEFLSQLSPNMRSTIERKSRKIIRECGAVFEKATRDEEVSSALAALFAFQRQRWAKVKAKDVENFQSFSLRMAQAMLRAGKLEMWALKVGTEPIAVAWNYRLKDTVYFYLSSFDQDERWNKYSIGTILLAFCMKNAIETGCHTFDMMRGDYSYKSRFTSVPHQNYRARLTQSAPVDYGYRAVDLQRLVRLRIRRRLRDVLKGTSQGSAHEQPGSKPADTD